MWSSLFVEPPSKASTIKDVYRSSRLGGWRMSASGKLVIVTGSALLLYSFYRQYTG